MKTKSTIKIALICILQMVFSVAYASIDGRTDTLDYDEDYCLEISGRASVKDIKSKGSYKAELILANEVVDSLMVKDNKRFVFNLKKDQHYAIRISKDGYVTRLIGISTHLNNPKYKDVFCRFRFNTEFITVGESDRLNADALDFPAAIVAFDEKVGWFDYSEKYTANIKHTIYYGTDPKRGLTSKY